MLDLKAQAKYIERRSLGSPYKGWWYIWGCIGGYRDTYIYIYRHTHGLGIMEPATTAQGTKLHMHTAQWRLIRVHPAPLRVP